MDDEPAAPDRAARPHERRPRRIGMFVALILFLTLVGAVAVAGSYYQGCREAPPRSSRPVDFEVPQGATGEDVLASLHAAGFVPCDGVVGNLLLRGTGRADQIRAGTYELVVGMTLDEILEVITTPPPKVPTIEATFVEGLRIDSPVAGREDIVSVVEDQLGLSGARFRELAESGRFGVPGILDRGESLEGFLFPATYEFVRKDLDEREVLQAMLDAFEQEAERLDLVAGAERLGFSPYEIVVIASMIEKEYQVADEGPLIAGVIDNRLELGMTLGIDATLLYDDPTPDGELSTADIETDTPYNTRLNGGLPPTPISSPGGVGGSLEWALDPAQTDFLYYVLCPEEGQGVHRFAETLGEHERNVDVCLG